MAFKNAEGNKGLQIDITYLKCIQQSVTCTNKLTEHLMQFPSRDDTRPQEKLAGKNIMNILKAAMPHKW
eukprot:12636389-Ditylum_brightwellii.AAC.1